MEGCSVRLLVLVFIWCNCCFGLLASLFCCFECGILMIWFKIEDALVSNTTKGRGCNKLKAPKEPLYVSVNNDGQPDDDNARKLSSFIGALARDPRMMPIDCVDFRKFGEDKIEHIWNIVQVYNAFYSSKILIILDLWILYLNVWCVTVLLF